MGMYILALERTGKEERKDLAESIVRLIDWQIAGLFSILRWKDEQYFGQSTKSCSIPDSTHM